MKKIVLLAVVSLMAMSACKKDRTCTCTLNAVSSTTTGLTPPTTPWMTETSHLTKVSKNGAHCVNSDATGTTTGDDGTGNIVTTVVVYKSECTLD